MLHAVVLGLVLSSGVEIGLTPHLREPESARVSPAPIGTGLPLKRSPGLDSFRRPRGAVDEARFRSLLLGRRFQELTRYVEELQREFERDPRTERWIEDAVGALSSPDAETREALDEWVAAFPGHFASYLARGEHWGNVAGTRRGGELARQTRPDEFSAMKQALAPALADLERALALRPRAVSALSALISAKRLLGDPEGCAEAFARAKALCPTCYYPRVSYLTVLSPRWYGSLEAMKRFVASSPVSENPRFALLAGFIDGERRDALWRERKYEEALAAADRAVAAGASSHQLLKRAPLAGYLRGPAAERADLIAALAVDPSNYEARATRARIAADAGRWEEAGRDLLAVLRVWPTMEKAVALRSMVVMGLARRGQALGAEGARGRREATRLLRLAADLSPDDPDLQARLAAWDAPRSPPRRPGPPPSGVSIPLTGVVLAPGGGPLPRARVFALGTAGAEDALAVHRLDSTSATESDAEGRFTLSLPPGPVLVVAQSPDDPASVAAVGHRLAAGHQGPLRVALRGTEALEGEVRDGAGAPLAGLQVRAFPDEGSASEGDPSFGVAVTDEGGRFRIGGLAPGRHRVFALGSGHASPLNLADGVRVTTGGGSLRVEARRVGILRGLVVQAIAGGASLPVATCSVRTPQGVFGCADGALAVPISGKWAKMPLVVEALGLAPLTLTVDLGPGEVKDLGLLTLHRGRTVRGRVLGADGAGVAGALVAAGPAAVPASFPWAVTDGAGRFALEALSGDSGVVHVRHAELGTVDASVQLGAEVEVRLSSGRRMALRVEDVDGTPLRGVWVRVASPKNAGTCQSDRAGACVVSGLAQADYHVDVARVPGDARPRPLPRQLQIPGVVPPDYEVIIRYPRTPSRAVVNVTRDGRPDEAFLFIVPGTIDPIRLTKTSPNPPFPHFRTRWASRHELDDLAPGRYSVLAVNSDTICGVGSLEVREGQAADVEISLASSPCGR